jgi:hypothetical protein
MSIRSEPDRTQTVTADSPLREVRYEYTPGFPQLLHGLRASLLVATHQADKLKVIGARDGRLTIAFRDFERVMGVAAGAGRVAVGTRRQVFFLQPAHEFAPRVQPAGSYDACWLARSSFVTSNIHETTWADSRSSGQVIRVSGLPADSLDEPESPPREP